MTLRSLAAVLVACAGCHHAREQKQLVVEVRAQLPGAGPEEVATSVAAPLEDELATIPHIAAITTETTEGMARVHVAFDSDDVLAAQQAVQTAITHAARMLPTAMPGPPTYSVVGAPAGRFLVPRDAALVSAERVGLVDGVGSVTICNERRTEKTVDVDSIRLSARALTITDVIEALRGAGSRPDLDGVLLAARNGVPILLRDIAQVRDSVVPPACQLMAPAREVGVLAIDARHAANVEEVRAAVSKAVSGAIVVPQRREAVAQLAPDVDLERVAIPLRDALAHVDGTYVVELRGRELTIIGGGEAALAALRNLPFVASAGEPTAVIHVSGADARAVGAAANAIANRLRQAGTLVATHGLETTTTTRFDIDRQRAADLDVSASEIATTLASITGVVAVKPDVVTHAQRLVVRISEIDMPGKGLDTLRVHGGGAMLVPLASVIAMHETSEPVEILRRNRVPDVDLEVHGDPTTAIGAVPAGIRVEVEPAP